MEKEKTPGARTEFEACLYQVGRIPYSKSRCTLYNTCVTLHALTLATSVSEHLGQRRHCSFRRGVMLRTLQVDSFILLHVTMSKYM